MVANMFSEESSYFNVVNGPLIVGKKYDLGIFLKYSVSGIIDGVFVTEHEYCGEIEGFHIFSRYCDMRRMFIVSEMTTGGIIAYSPLSAHGALLKARYLLEKNKEKAYKIMKKHQERYYVNILVEDISEHLIDKVIEKQKNLIAKRNPVQVFLKMMTDKPI
ncbi:hypothetical protein P4283_22870 [Bacillus thuringiensis]|nr:hypothetical protein [Bacillus thuringiensis]